MKTKRYNADDRVPESVDSAFTMLDNFRQGVPYEAIRYLRERKSSKRITSKIIHSLQNAYTGFYFDKKENYNAPTPLWYAIVAETHLSKELIDPIINLFSTDDDWDALNEQGEFLIGLLSDAYPRITASRVMDFVDKMIAQNSSSPYLYLFDALYKASLPKHKAWFLKTLESKKLYWGGLFVGVVADLGITEAAPIIKKRLASIRPDDFDRGEYEYALEKFVKGPSLYPPYCKTRGDWEDHLIIFEKTFFDDDNDDEKPEPVLRKIKIGRNEPCPCGKTKSDGKPVKYKKCCGAI